MKRIFITESQEEMLKNVIKESLSPDSTFSLRTLYENTPLKDIIPEKYAQKLLEKRKGEVEGVVNKLFPISNFNKSEEVENALSKILAYIIKTEENIKEFLEKLCFDSINEMFSIPEGVVNITCDLVNEIPTDGSFIHISPISSEVEFNSSDELLNADIEIEKRMLLNLFIIGASVVLTKYLLKEKKHEINQLDKTLYTNYKKVLWINEYILSNTKVEITDKTPNQAGVVLVKLGGERKQTEVISKGQCLPILIYETIKGMFELFISHGLPEDRRMAEYIIDQSDLLEYEQNAMVIGPIVWNKVMNVMGNNDIDTNVLPHFTQKLSMMGHQEISNLFKEVLLNTKLGKQKIEDMLLSIQNEIDYDEFETRMSTKRDKRNMINDNEYLSDEELLNL